MSFRDNGSLGTCFFWECLLIHCWCLCSELRGLRLFNCALLNPVEGSTQYFRMFGFSGNKRSMSLVMYLLTLVGLLVGLFWIFWCLQLVLWTLKVLGCLDLGWTWSLAFKWAWNVGEELDLDMVDLLVWVLLSIDGLLVLVLVFGLVLTPVDLLILVELVGFFFWRCFLVTNTHSWSLGRNHVELPW